MSPTRAMATVASTPRTVLGFVVAPVLPLVPAIALSSNDLAPAGLSVAAAVGYAIALFVGIPFHLLLRSQDLHGAWAYLVGGGVLGCLPCIVLFWFAERANWLWMFATFVGYGASAGLVFWLVVFWRPRRPTRDDGQPRAR